MEEKELEGDVSDEDEASEIDTTVKPDSDKIGWNTVTMFVSFFNVH